MGIDLTVSPIYTDMQYIWLAHSRLELCRNYELFSYFANIGRTEIKPIMTPRPLPDGVKIWWYNNEGIEKRTQDPYGAPLTYVTPQDVRRIPLDRLNKRDRATIAFLQELPDDTPILLWWH